MHIGIVEPSRNKVVMSCVPFPTQPYEAALAMSVINFRKWEQCTLLIYCRKHPRKYLLTIELACISSTA